jgi:competence protein ComEA
MDQSAAPWRALEDDAATGAGGASAEFSASDPTRAAASRSRWVAIAIAAAALVAGAAIWLVATNGSGAVVVDGGGPGPVRSGQVALGDRSPAQTSGSDLVVDVQGAVVRPGIVHLPAGSRVADAIAAAGGYGPRVAADRVGQTLNLAALVRDGDQVVVPSRDDRGSTTPTGAGASGTAGGGSPVDLNHATVAELDALPGIGPVTAAKIVAARDAQAFASVDDLRTRKILGAATFDKVKDLVVVR